MKYFITINGNPAIQIERPLSELELKVLMDSLKLKMQKIANRSYYTGLSHCEDMIYHFNAQESR